MIEEASRLYCLRVRYESQRSTAATQGAGKGPTGGWRFGDFKQHRAGLHVSDLEPGEVDVVNVLIAAAQVI